MRAGGLEAHGDRAEQQVELVVLHEQAEELLHLEVLGDPAQEPHEQLELALAGVDLGQACKKGFWRNVMPVR